MVVFALYIYKGMSSRPIIIKGKAQIVIMSGGTDTGNRWDACPTNPYGKRFPGSYPLAFIPMYGIDALHRFCWNEMYKNFHAQNR